jgi:uncharacterized protein with HEPN domain
MWADSRYKDHLATISSTTKESKHGKKLDDVMAALPKERRKRVQGRGEITSAEVLYDAVLRNLQTLSEATQQLPDNA